MSLVIFQNHKNYSNACLILNITTANGLWKAENPQIESISLLIAQLAFVIFFTRFLYFILRPLHQPRIVTDILGGLLLGPSFFGKRKSISHLFPLKSVTTLETIAYMALDFYVFLLGLETDVSSIQHASKIEFHIAVAGALVPMGVGSGLYFLSQRLLHLPPEPSGCLFWGLTLTVTGFPEVARILEELRLRHTEGGRMALSTAMISDICSWILIAMVLPTRLSPQNGAFAVSTTIAFILICVYVVRPFLVWIIRRTSKSNEDNNIYSDYYLCFVLIGAMLCSFVTEVSGTYSIIGAFVFGIIMPDRELGAALIERFEDFVSGIMLPLFFAICGIKINLHSVDDWFLGGTIVFLASLPKILSTLLVSLFYHMPFQDSFALGILLNTKGILALVILNFGWDKKILQDPEYAVIAVTMVVMTAVVSVIIKIIYYSSACSNEYEGRNIQHTKQGAELRILACLHSVENAPSIINLLSFSNATKQSPIFVYALHLVELTGGASAMLIVHNTSKNGGTVQSRIENTLSDQIIGAFEKFENQNTAVSVRPLTSVSPRLTMHEDVCFLAEDKRIAFMILPFHALHCNTNSNCSLCEINLNILANAPCSVGILMDKGLREPAMLDHTGMMHVVILFIGGPDDREALAFARRMLGHPLVQLTVLRLLPGRKESNRGPCFYVSQRQNQLDAEYVNEFRLKTAGENVTYTEKMSNNGEETIEVLKEMEDEKVDLYIVGKDVTASPVTAGLLEWCDCPEIGAMGDLLVFSDFVRGSVLIVEQYVGAEGDAGALSSTAWNGELD